MLRTHFEEIITLNHITVMKCISNVAMIDKNAMLFVEISQNAINFLKSDLLIFHYVNETSHFPPLLSPADPLPTPPTTSQTPPNFLSCFTFTRVRLD